MRDIKNDSKVRIYSVITGITGTKFGKLQAIAEPDRTERSSNASSNGPLVKCSCECGNIVNKRLYPLRRGTINSCGCVRSEKAIANAMKITKRREMRGGARTIFRNNGYAMLYIPDHPRSSSNGYVFEHIVVMERMIGRYLARTENVHHINGVREDNQPGNLELWDTAHPPGQRHSDKMRFYMGELLKKCDRKFLAEFCSSFLR